MDINFKVNPDNYIVSIFDDNIHIITDYELCNDMKTFYKILLYIIYNGFKLDHVYRPYLRLL